MTEEFAVQFLSNAVYTTIIISGPILLVTLIIGFLIGVFQAATSINEMTLTFIPKIVGVVVVILILLPWMLNVMQAFTLGVFEIIPMLSK